MRLLSRLQNNDSALVFFDPSGDAYHRLKRWAYSENLDSRLLLIDPSEQRMVCGINPVAPWPDNHRVQAALGWNTLKRAMDEEEFSPMPLLRQWMLNTLYGLIDTGLTMHEAPNVLAFENQVFREALIARITDTAVQGEFELLNRLISDQRFNSAYKEWQYQAGAAYRRVMEYSWNEYLGKMLGTTQHVVDWGDVIDNRKIVLINLNPSGEKRTYLTPENVRMFGLQLLSQLIDECFHRVEAAGVSAPPCYCFVDEFQHFVSTNMERVLSEGRKFNLRLILAHRSPAELFNRRTGDDVLHRLVSSCTQLKIVFGGLEWKDTEPLAWTTAAHHLNLDEVKDEIQTMSQLHHVEQVESSMESYSGAEHQGHSSGYGTSELYNQDLDKIVSGTSSAFGDAMGTVRGWGYASTSHSMVVPSEPFSQVTSRTFRSIEEQMHRITSKLVSQPDQHATVAIQKEEPILFKITTLHEPAIAVEQARGLDLELMRSLPCYATPELIEEEINDRQAALLAPGKPAFTPTPLLPEHRIPKKSNPKDGRGQDS